MNEINYLRLRALAKINLGLDVLRKREDGYHEVRMIMQTINLYDKIEMVKIDGRDIQISTNLYYLPTNENNLVYRAAKLLIDEFNIKDGVKINLQKYIPVAAGLAGGSSDAAAVLFGMNKMFSLNLSMEDLKKRGVKLGADVPYCLMRGTALAEGIGEKLTVLPGCPRCFVLIAKPPISVSTKFVYENLHVSELVYHPDIDGIISAISDNDLYGMAKRMGNVLENVTIKEYPAIQQIKQDMISHGAINSLMSGSGPTVFGIFDDMEKARQSYRHLREGNVANQVYLTDTFNE